MVACTLFARDGLCVRNAAQAIANVAYGSHSAVAKCMAARADAALCSERLLFCGLLRPDAVLRLEGLLVQDGE